MTAERFQRIDALFRAAVREAPARRAAFLHEACADDSELRAEVESLLEFDADAATLMQRRITSSGQLPDLGAGLLTGVPGYEILRQLGAGGMGVVYEAEQCDPRRRVALKVIRTGLGIDPEYGKLFEREIRTLARLKHPGIATIHDAGCTPDGRRFFAMELVDGPPLMAFVAGRYDGSARGPMRLSDRLGLFRRICEAVAYAHQRGVIHRDLKPANILVTTELQISDFRSQIDGQTAVRDKSAICNLQPLTPGGGVKGGSAIPKVLDFGLARLTDPDANVSLTADAGRIRGTLTYMSPEQAYGRIEEVDLRSDVYSLGVILYELLTGRVPLDLRECSLGEALRRIRDEAPPAPRRVNRELDGEIQIITLKALEKDADRRYQSAAALADDLMRYLTHQPIAARPASAAYRRRKLARRRPGLVYGAGSTVLAILVGLAGTFRYAYQAQAERNAAWLAEGRATRSADQATAERNAAQQAEARATRRFDELRELARAMIMDMEPKLSSLAGATPARQFVVDTGLRYLDGLAKEAGDDPALQYEVVWAYLKIADIQGALGRPNLGDTLGAQRSYGIARSLCEQSLAQNPPNAADLRRVLAFALDGMGDVQLKQRQVSASAETYAEALRIAESVFDSDPADRNRYVLAKAHWKLGDAQREFGQRGLARASFERAHEMARLLPDEEAYDIRKRFIASRLHGLQMQAGAYEEAVAGLAEQIPAMERLVLEAADDASFKRELAALQIDYGDALRELNRTDEALTAFESARSLLDALADADPSDVFTAMRAVTAHERVGHALFLLGRREESLQIQQHALERVSALCEREAAPEHLRQLSVIHEKIGNAQTELGQADEAIDSFTQSLQIRERLAADAATSPGAERDIAVSYFKLGAGHAAAGADGRRPAADRLEGYRAARASFEQSLAVVKSLEDRGRLATSDARVPDLLRRNLAECEAKLAELDTQAQPQN